MDNLFKKDELSEVYERYVKFDVSAEATIKRLKTLL